MTPPGPHFQPMGKIDGASAMPARPAGGPPAGAAFMPAGGLVEAGGMPRPMGAGMPVAQGMPGAGTPASWRAMDGFKSMSGLPPGGPAAFLRQLLMPGLALLMRCEPPRGFNVLAFAAEHLHGAPGSDHSDGEAALRASVGKWEGRGTGAAFMRSLVHTARPDTPLAAPRLGASLTEPRNATPGGDSSTVAVTARRGLRTGAPSATPSPSSSAGPASSAGPTRATAPLLTGDAGPAAPGAPGSPPRGPAQVGETGLPTVSSGALPRQTPQPGASASPTSLVGGESEGGAPIPKGESAPSPMKQVASRTDTSGRVTPQTPGVTSTSVPGRDGYSDGRAQQVGMDPSSTGTAGTTSLSPAMASLLGSSAAAALADGSTLSTLAHALFAQGGTAAGGGLGNPVELMENLLNRLSRYLTERGQGARSGDEHGDLRTLETLARQPQGARFVADLLEKVMQSGRNGAQGLFDEAARSPQGARSMMGMLADLARQVPQRVAGMLLMTADTPAGLADLRRLLATVGTDPEASARFADLLEQATGTPESAAAVADLMETVSRGDGTLGRGPAQAMARLLARIGESSDALHALLDALENMAGTETGKEDVTLLLCRVLSVYGGGRFAVQVAQDSRASTLFASLLKLLSQRGDLRDTLSAAMRHLTGGSGGSDGERFSHLASTHEALSEALSHLDSSPADASSPQGGAFRPGDVYSEETLRNARICPDCGFRLTRAGGCVRCASRARSQVSGANVTQAMAT